MNNNEKYITISRSAIECYQSWVAAREEADYAARQLSATAAFTPTLIECIRELDIENERLRKAADRATTLLAEVNTAYSLSIHERFERTRAAYDILNDALSAPPDAAQQRYDGPPPPESPFKDDVPTSPPTP